MSRTLARTSPLRVMPRGHERRPAGRPLGDLCLRPGERPADRRPMVTDDHQPVMVEEVLHFLAPRPGGSYLDATVGAGGHAEAILRAVGGRATLIGVDRDPEALARASYNLRPFGGGVRLVRADFRDVEWIVRSLGTGPLDGVLFDLGMSSMQLDDPARGFSFRRPGPLDMRMDPAQDLTAADVVNTYSEGELERVLRTWGEERHAARIARALVEARRRAPIRTTTELASIVERCYPRRGRTQHPARRTFQALRIEVNGELEALEGALASLPPLLRPGGRIVVISYHSLEDRITKRAFARFERRGAALPGLGTPPAEGLLDVLTPGAVLPSTEEVERNPRASSARLRAAARRA